METDDRAPESRERLSRICERLGLDAAQTTDIRIEIPSDGRVLVTWTGVRKVKLDQIADLLA